jgi:hypothetical protein
MIPHARSLKDKRSAIKSLKDRMSNRFNVSVAEVDLLDVPQSALLGVAMVSNESAHVRSALDTVVDFLRAPGPAILVDYTTEIL